MKPLRFLIGTLPFLALALFGFKQLKPDAQTSPIRQILLDQLKSTHDKKDWFVPANIAVDGINATQAMWADKSGNHSVGQLVKHLIFWNERELSKVKGEKPADYNGNNNETFNNKLDEHSWPATIKRLDKVMTDWENFLQQADDSQLQKHYATIANVSTHNAYHIGQMVFVRKQQGVWDSEKGVK